MRFYADPHYTPLNSLLFVLKRYTVQRSLASSKVPNYKPLIFVNHLCLRFIFCATFSPGSQQPETTLKSWHNSNKISRIMPALFGYKWALKQILWFSSLTPPQQWLKGTADQAPFLHWLGWPCLVPPNSVCSTFQKEKHANIWRKSSSDIAMFYAEEMFIKIDSENAFLIAMKKKKIFALEI